MHGARLWLAAGLTWTAGLGFDVAGDALTLSARSLSGVATWSWERRAEAAPMFSASTKVVLFTPGRSDPLIARIEAELSALGIAVQKMPAPPESQLDAVVTREIAAGASAAIRIIPHSRKTEVWTGDTTARVSSRRSIKPEISDAALSLIALRTVEFLRASLLDVKRRAAGNGAPGTTTGVAAGASSATGGATATPAAPVETTATPAVTTAPSRGSFPDSQPSSRSAVTGVAPPLREVPPPSERSAAADQAPGSGNAVDNVVRERAAEGTSARAAGPSTPAPRFQPAPAGVPERQAESTAPPQTEQTRGRLPTPDENKARAETPAENADGGDRTNAGISRRFEIAAGAGVLASPGGMAPMGALTVIGRAPIVGRFGVELMTVFPLIPNHKTTGDGAVETSIALFGGAGTFRLTAAGSPWLVDLALGASVTMLRSAGSAMGAAGNTPNTGSTVSSQMATAHMRLGAGYRLNRWLVIRVDAIGGALASRLSVGTLHTDTTGAIDASKLNDFGGWGPLFGGGALGLQASW